MRLWKLLRFWVVRSKVLKTSASFVTSSFYFFTHSKSTWRFWCWDIGGFTHFLLGNNSGNKHGNKTRSESERHIFYTDKAHICTQGQPGKSNSYLTKTWGNKIVCRERWSLINKQHKTYHIRVKATTEDIKSEPFNHRAPPFLDSIYLERKTPVPCTRAVTHSRVRHAKFVAARRHKAHSWHF